MSDSQAYEEVTVASDGVVVVKRFEEDEFPVPAIAFKFQNRRDEEVTVRLRDRVPEGVAVEDLGFHPEYGSEYWTVDQDQIRFERAMEAGSEYTTVYGIRATGTDDVEQFLTEPEIEQVDPPLPEDEQVEGGDEVIPESDDDVVREVIAGEAEDMPDQDDREEATDEEVETLDLKDPNQAEAGATQDGTGGGAVAGGAGGESESTDGGASGGSGAADAGGGGGDSGGSGGSVEVDGSNLVTALAAEIRQNNVSAEDVKLLRQAFEIAGQEGGSVVARIQRLQSDVSDLRAYTDALEEFLDGSGTAKQVIEGFEADIDELESQLAKVQSKMGENSREVASVSEEVSNLEAAVSTVQEDVEGFEDELTDVGADVEDVRTIVRDVRDTVDEVTAEVEDVREEVDGVTHDVDEVRQELDGMSAEVEDVREDVDGVSGDVDEVQETIDDVQTEIEDLRAEVADVDVEERLDSLAREVQDLQEWQDQIKETFGGGN